MRVEDGQYPCRNLDCLDAAGRLGWRGPGAGADERQIIGKELNVTRKGVNVRLTNLPNGEMTLKMLVLSFSGAWGFEGNRTCMTLAEGPRKGRNCGTVTPLGRNSFFNSEGNRHDRSEPISMAFIEPKSLAGPCASRDTEPENMN